MLKELGFSVSPGFETSVAVSYNTHFKIKPSLNLTNLYPGKTPVLILAYLLPKAICLFVCFVLFCILIAMVLNVKIVWLRSLQDFFYILIFLNI